MMGMVYTMIDDSSSRIRSVTTEDFEWIQVQQAFDRIESDFSQMYSPRFYSGLYQKPKGKEEDDPYAENTLITERFPQLSEYGERIPVFESEEKSEIVFMTSAHRRRMLDVKQSRFTWVRYFLESMPEAKEGEDEPRAEFQLMRSSVPEGLFLDSFSWDKEKSYPILKNVKSVRFEYWKGKKGSKKTDGRYVEKINELEKDDLPPRLIQAVIEWVPKGGEEAEEYKRSFKVLWPNFDVALDQKIREEAKKQKPKGQKK